MSGRIWIASVLYLSVCFQGAGVCSADDAARKRAQQQVETLKIKFLVSPNNRALAGKQSDAPRLMLQTGSQAEQSKGMGLVTNGLDAKNDYKVYCYVTATKDGQTNLEL